jgi:predicted component of type VI protein secretion system
MDLQTRKLDFIQDFLKYANTSILEKFEEVLRQEREKELEQEIKPMTIKQYEQRISKALKDVELNRIKSARALKNEIATWK